MADMADVFGTVIIGGMTYKAYQDFMGKKSVKRTKRKLNKSKNSKR